MEFDRNVERKSEKKRSGFDFTVIRSGDSIWFSSRAEIEALRRAFKVWKDATKAPLTIESEAVGHEDPKGSGYRAFFEAEAVTLKPIVMAKLPKMENLTELQDWRMRYTGVESNEDIIAAILSLGSPPPATVTEANAARRLLFAGKTPLQVERMAEMGHRSFEECVTSSMQEDAERLRKKHEWPEDDGRDVTPGYFELSDDQRRELHAEAMIENEDEYLKAMRSRPVGEAVARSLGAVIGGYSDFTTWKVRQKARAGSVG